MKLQRLQAWWQARAWRERLLLLASGIAVSLMLADTALTLPLERRLRIAQAELQTLRAGHAPPLADRSASADDGGAAQLRAQEHELRARLQAALAAAHAAEERASEAARLPEMLRDIAATVGAARLLALDLSPDAGAATPSDAPARPAGRRLYRLPITIKVSGSYEELLLLLQQVERHAPALQWSQLSLDGSDWPAVQLTLHAHVASLAARWGSS